MKIMNKCFFKAVELERGGPVVDWTLLAISFYFYLLEIFQNDHWKLFLSLESTNQRFNLNLQFQKTAQKFSPNK